MFYNPSVSIHTHRHFTCFFFYLFTCLLGQLSKYHSQQTEPESEQGQAV